MAQSDRMQSFEEFWPYYVREHSTSGCRALHFIGSTLALACLASVALTGRVGFLPLGLLLGYGFAWTGHFFIEHNRPATFQYPLWSLRADWKMWALMLVGKMGPELERAVRAA